MKKNGKICECEDRMLNWMASNGVTLLRISIGIVFVWFGVQKFFPGVSSAEGLATSTIEVLTFGLVTTPFAMPILAAWEVIVGIGFLTGWCFRATFVLLYLQMAGTLAPLFVFPEVSFYNAPWVPTLVGQYIIKNIIIITAAMVILANSRGKTISPCSKTISPCSKPTSD